MLQILHSIDNILDPVILSPKYSPNAFDFLSKPYNWNLPGGIEISKFIIKVQETQMHHIYKEGGPHTFFVPIDSEINSHNFKLLDSHRVKGHIIPGYVLFSRPTEKNLAYETLSKDAVFTVLSFRENGGKFFVHAQTTSYGRKLKEFSTEIVFPNIPVTNGVVHLISKPIIDDGKAGLGMFPLLPILTKISTDPELEITYNMGQLTKFNKIFTMEGLKFTYFVPKDWAWIQADKKGLEATDEDLDILKRHLIVSSSAYFMEQLESLSKTSNDSYVELKSEGGYLKITVLKIDQDYYIKWNNKYIRVLRPNFECTDGIVHIIAGPMVDFQRPQPIALTTYNRYWKTFSNVVKKKLNV